MNNLTTEQGTLCLSHVSLQSIADRFGTPCYVYDADTITAQFNSLDKAITVPHRLCYAMKANSNGAIIQHLADLGAGFDIVSMGELARALKAGADPAHIVFSGVGKSRADIRYALKAGIGCLTCESIPEIERIDQIANELNTHARIALRINPDIQVHTHHHIATGNKEHKFGIAYELLDSALDTVKACSRVRLIGIACHLGSQLNDLEPYAKALDRMITCYQLVLDRGFTPEFLDMGGGMGIDYGHEHALDISALATLFNTKIAPLGCKLLLEPGRMIIGPAGLLLTQIEYIKHSYHKRFAIVDAGMNDLVRPAMYDAFHRIIPVTPREGEAHTYDVVGPVCESSDYMGKQRTLTIEPGDLLAILDAGAYGSSMSSCYNSRPFIAEVMIVNQTAICIRRRGTLADLWAHEYPITSIPFTKMHALGNDFVVINADNLRVSLSADIIQRLADRHRGIGCDQVLVIRPTDQYACFDYHIYNADGCEASHCGNGARAVARFVTDQGLCDAAELTFKMPSRTIYTHRHDADHISVDMGAVTIAPAFQFMFDDHPLRVTPIMIGNPHAIIESDHALDLKALGELLNHHPTFPEGVNVSVIHFNDSSSLNLLVYERGVGITEACGTAACAAVAYGLQEKRLSSPCTVHMPGGTCEVSASDHNTIILTGSATRVFEGVWHDEA